MDVPVTVAAVDVVDVKWFVVDVGRWQQRSLSLEVHLAR